MRRYPLDGPVYVDWQAEIPRSSGLSGSTALLAATLFCVLAARGETPDLSSPTATAAYAELVRDIERNEADIVCGFQDAYMIVHGGLNRMDFVGKHPVNPGPYATLTPIDVPLPFLLITTGVERLSGSVHGPMMHRWLSGEPEVVAKMVRAGELGRIGAAAIVAQNWGDLAEAMKENHGITASLGGSGTEIDTLVAACLESGALAAKLAGAGLGGTVIALTHDADALETQLRSRGYSRFIRPERVGGVSGAKVS